MQDAVTYLHSHNIIHRDLKPENILYRTPPGTNGVGHDDCVVSDFGLALQLDSPNQVLHTHCMSPRPIYRTATPLTRCIRRIARLLGTRVRPIRVEGHES